MFQIEERLLPLGRTTNRPGTLLKPTEVVCHRTGNTNPRADALAHYRYFSGGYRASSAHYFVDSRRILRTIPENEVAWHAGPVANAKAIGVELCENNPPGTLEFDMAYRRYVWLVADICNRYGLHPAMAVKGHFEYDPINRPNDPHGLLAAYFKTDKTAAWRKFKADLLGHASHTETPAGHPILGVPTVTIDQARAFLRQKAPGWEGMAELYWGIAPAYGVRPEVALAQACKETGYFRYGGAVTPDMNNFCGLKVRSPKGDRKEDHASFPDRATGVEAHLQHLARYAGNTNIPAGHVVVDPRWELVIPGVAKTVEELGGRWAPNPDYGRSIVADYLKPLTRTVDAPATPLTVARTEDPEDEIARMKEAGLILDAHRPDDPVKWGQFAAVINRLRKG